MNWIEFKDALSSYKIFSVRDAKKYFPDFDTRRLVEWQKKNYIQKLINKWYLFTGTPVDELLLFRISNCLYRPSYISLETALAFYQLIPEAAFSMQAITTRKTIAYTTTAGYFNYRSLKTSCYFGYRILHTENLPVLIAEPEKALLDYLYLSGSLLTIKDIAALRINYTTLQQKVDWDKLVAYAQVFNSRALDKRIKQLKKISIHVHPA